MSYINDNIRINQLNIPGTHDSGTYDIGQLSNNKVLESLVERSILAPYSQVLGGLTQTQELDITEQLEHGIRYFDIRLTISNKNDKKLHLTHEFIPCINIKNKYKYLYFSDVLSECSEFLDKHYNETVILHLKSEDLPSGINSTHVANLIFNDLDKYRAKIYTLNSFPSLGKVRGQMVIVTRDEFKTDSILVDDTYKKVSIGNVLSWKDMGGCEKYNNKYDCCPKLNGDLRVQDAYNLDGSEKWELARDIIDNAIFGCKSQNEFLTINDINKLTINFMSTARAHSFSLEALPQLIHDISFDAGIEDTANYVNTKLTKYILEREKNFQNKMFNNEWIFLDFPSLDVVRAIYQSNGYLNPELTADKVEISDKEYIIANAKYYVALIPMVGSAAAELTGAVIDVTATIGETIVNTVESVADAVGSFFKGFFSKREISEYVKVCLQRKTLANGNEIVIVNSKCKNNPKNKWTINSHNEYYNIISGYDSKCLEYENGSLNVVKCKTNRKNQDFSIKHGVICSRIDGYK
ncbi:PLC-like phosphodiesterase, partial [Piromyces finnis]